MSSNDGFKLNFDPLADKELLNSINWYEEILPDLGLEFMNEVKTVLEIIEENPYTFQLRKHQVREAPVKKFPFQIVYKIYPKKNEILIVSVFHTSRNPKGKHKRK